MPSRLAGEYLNIDLLLRTGQCNHTEDRGKYIYNLKFEDGFHWPAGGGGVNPGTNQDREKRVRVVPGRPDQFSIGGDGGGDWQV